MKRPRPEAPEPHPVPEQPKRPKPEGPLGSDDIPYISHTMP